MSKPTTSDRLAALESAIAEAQQRLAALKAEPPTSTTTPAPDASGFVEEVLTRLAALETGLPVAYKRLSRAAVRDIVAADPYAEFEVLAPWHDANGRVYAQGQTLRADRVPYLADMVQAGLAVNLPQGHDATLARYQELAAARKTAADEALRATAAATAAAAAKVAQDATAAEG